MQLKDAAESFGKDVVPVGLPACVWEEQLLAAELVAGDGGLTLVTQYPVDERLALVGLNVAMFVRIYQDDAVLIEECLVTFHDDTEITLVLEADPGATVRQGISTHADCRVESRPHARTGFAVPGTARGGRVAAGALP